jgi:hypothetical protein
LIRQQKRRKEREQRYSEEEFHKEFHKKTFLKQIVNEDTGQTHDYLMTPCPTCKSPECTVFNLAEWSEKKNKYIFKVTGKDPETNEDIYDWWCVACGYTSETLHDNHLKRLMEKFYEQSVKQDRFPDEYWSNAVQQLRRKRPEYIEAVNEMRGRSLDIVGYLRRSRTYKSYPKSLSDEDRLMLTLYSFDIKMGDSMERTDLSFNWLYC